MITLQKTPNKEKTSLDIDARTTFEAGLAKLRKKVHEICATINAQEDCPFLRNRIYTKCEECPYKDGTTL